VNKPPVITNGQALEWARRRFGEQEDYHTIASQDDREAQRDADVEWFRQSKCDHCDTPLLREGELYEKLEQTRREVAMEIFEHLEDEGLVRQSGLVLFSTELWEEIKAKYLGE